MAEQRFNRWWLVVGAIVIQLCLGAIYAWSVFRTPLCTKFSCTVTEATLPFALVLVFFALATILGGRWQDRSGPRIVASVGGVLLGAGLVLAGFMPSILGVALAYGVVAGIGIGLAYVCPIATCVKWFPDMRGLITGLSVAGFGAGALIVAPVARWLIDSRGTSATFIILGIVFLVGVVLGAQILRTPPPGWKPAGFVPSARVQETTSDYGPGRMLATPQFYVVWVMYFFACTAGLMTIGQTAPIGTDLAGLTKATAAIGVSVLAIFNAVGRILWGRVSDTLGRMRTLFIMFLISGVAMLLYNVIPTFHAYYWIGIALVGLCFGGYLAVFPAVTADLYGTRNAGVNYGLVFTAYGVGGLLGNVFAPTVLQRTHAYTLAFVVTGILCLVGALLTFLARAPRLKAAQA